MCRFETPLPRCPPPPDLLFTIQMPTTMSGILPYSFTDKNTCLEDIRERVRECDIPFVLLGLPGLEVFCFSCQPSDADMPNTAPR